jgi:hypothetical protein
MTRDCSLHTHTASQLILSTGQCRNSPRHFQKDSAAQQNFSLEWMFKDERGSGLRLTSFT